MTWTRWAIAVVAMVYIPRDASADPEPLPLVLTWEAPPPCPDASFVQRRVAELVEGRRQPTTVHASVRVAKSEGRFELTLVVRSANGEDSRMIDAASCSALAEASAVVIALAMAPPTDERRPAEESPPVSADTGGLAPPPVEPAVDSAKLPETSSPPSRLRSSETVPTTRLGIGLGSALGIGTLPGLGAGFVGAVTLRHHGARLGVHGTFWLRQRPMYAPGAGASFDMAELGVFGCYTTTLRELAVGPCANLEATVMRVEGFGIRMPRASWSRWPTAGLGARGEVRLSRWLVMYVRADLLFPIDAPDFTLGRSGVVLHRPALAAGRFGLGAEIVLP